MRSEHAPNFTRLQRQSAPLYTSEFGPMEIKNNLKPPNVSCIFHAHGLEHVLSEDSQLGKHDLMAPLALLSGSKGCAPMPLHHTIEVKLLPHLLLAQRLWWWSAIFRHPCTRGDGLIECFGVPPEVGLPVQLWKRVFVIQDDLCGRSKSTAGDFCRRPLSAQPPPGQTRHPTARL